MQKESGLTVISVYESTLSLINVRSPSKVGLQLMSIQPVLI